MAFKDVPAKVDFPAQERELIQFWRETDAFDRAAQSPRARSALVVYRRANHGQQSRWACIMAGAAPIRISSSVSGRCAATSCATRTVSTARDCGWRWRSRRNKGFKSKKDIEDFGLEQFVRLCKARVLRYAAVQTEQSIRLGYWMDWNDPDLLRIAGRINWLATPMKW